MASALTRLIGSQFTLVTEDVLVTDTPVSAIEVELAALQGRVDLAETAKRQLVNARVGQGLFKNNVRLNENCLPHHWGRAASPPEGEPHQAVAGLHLIRRSFTAATGCCLPRTSTTSLIVASSRSRTEGT